jgi:hypothetical protein
MKLTHICTALSMAAALASGGQLLANDISYANLAHTNIVFNGTGGFSFSNTGTPAANIQITGSTTGDSVGLMGEITGNYQIGAITHAGPVSSANVTGTGTFLIRDGADTLTATVNWDDITQIGTGSTLNDNGQVNLTNILYSGTNVDLVDLKDALTASNVLDFTFTPAETLAALKTHRVSTSFSGSINYAIASVPDSSNTALLTGLGLVAIAAGLVGQKRKQRSA